MAFTVADLADDKEIESVLIEDGEPTSIDAAKSRLEDIILTDDQPFVMYRFLEPGTNQLRTAVLYQQAGGGGTVRLTFEAPNPHPVKLLLGTLAEFLYPTAENGFAQESDLLTSIQNALRDGALDAHFFDGGQGKAG